LAEFIGTFFVTAVAITIDVLYYSGSHVDYVSRWLARGFVTAAVIYALSDVSGAHVDPAVSVGFAVRGAMSARAMFAYWAAQFAGSFAAAGCALALFGPRLWMGASRPGPAYSQVEAAVIEVVLTFGVVLVILACAQQEAVIGKQSALAVGLMVAACGLFAGPLSGASMNPARSIAPQVLSGQFQLIWIYAVGPLVGAVLAALVTFVLLGWPDRGEKRAAGRVKKPSRNG
jgi:aquaporin Z